MRPFVRAIVVALALGPPAALFLQPQFADASVAYESPYSFEQTFGSAMRLLRVDLGCKITEKDADSGYVLFEYTSGESGKRVHKGSLEVVRGKATHVALQLPTLPGYHEQMIVDALIKKLSSEHGEPPKTKPRSPPAPVEDGCASDAAQ